MAFATITADTYTGPSHLLGLESASETPELPLPRTLTDAWCTEYACADSPLELARQLSAILRRNTYLCDQNDPASNRLLDAWMHQERVQLQYSDPQLLAAILDRATEIQNQDFPDTPKGDARSACIVGGLLCHATFRIWNGQRVAHSKPLAETYNLQSILSISPDAEPTPAATMHGWQTMARLLLWSSSRRYSLRTQ